MTDALRDFPNKYQYNKNKISELRNIISYVGGLVSPENDSVMDELQQQWDSMFDYQRDLINHAIAELKALLASPYKDEQRIFDDEGELEEIVLVYTDAVVIIRREGRRVFWMGDNMPCYQDFTPEIELWLESGKLMSDYNDVPF